MRVDPGTVILVNRYPMHFVGFHYSWHPELCILTMMFLLISFENSLVIKGERNKSESEKR